MKPARILVVDDSAADRTSLKVAFQRCNYPIALSFAEDGEAALGLLRGDEGQPPLRPNMMLVDMKMPGVSGLELLRRIKADPQLRAIPVMILSSSDDPRDVHDAYQCCASGYVRKPGAFDALKRIAEVVGALCAETLCFPDPVT